jgi:hypothetical protein
MNELEKQKPRAGIGDNLEDTIKINFKATFECCGLNSQDSG